MQHFYQNLNRSEGHWIRDILLLTLILGTIFLSGLGSFPLIDPDEGRYAEIPREMIQAGDLITPTLNHVKYFEKPPMLYWLNAASMYIFGKNEFAARFPSAFTGLLTTIITYLAGRRLFSRKTGLIAAMILASSAGFVMQSRIILTDMLLTLFVSAAMFAFIMGSRRATRSKVFWFQLFFAFSALALLTKGLIGILIPGMVIFFYLLFTKQWKLLVRIPWTTGVLVFLAITLPWFISVSIKNPEFPRFFFIHEHFERFTSKVHGRYQPFWYFIPVMIATLFPWFTQIPGAIYSGWKRWKVSNENPDLFLILWSLLPFLFFSFSSSKLMPYMLPICPPLALMIANRFTAAVEKRPERTRKASMVTAFLLVSAGLLLTLFSSVASVKMRLSSVIPPDISEFMNSYRVFAGISLPAFSGSILLLLGLLILFLVFRRARATEVIIIATMFSGVVLTYTGRTVYENAYAPDASSKSFSLEINKRFRDGDRIAAIGYEQGINFYTGKRAIVVHDRGELDFGSRQGDNSSWFLEAPGFFQLWMSANRFFCISDRVILELFPAVFKESQVIARRGNRILLLNRP